MALKGSLSTLGTMFGWESPDSNIIGLKDMVQQLRGLKQTVIAGGTAGDHTVTGIATGDHLISVVHLDMTGNAETDLTSEFSITAADTINNAAGTDTSSDTLLVLYFDQSAGA
jgi:hypothetical protein